MKLANISDQKLIDLIKEDHDYLGIVYKKNKEYCIAFMKSRISRNNISEDDLNDIFQEAMIIFYEKIQSGNFELTSSIQTYLNSICRFQLLNLIRSNRKTFNYDDSVYQGVKMQFDPNINGSLEPIDYVNDEQFNALERALKALKEAGGHCYELLTLYWYHKKSMKELATHFGYTNSANAKVQKSKCQQRLKKLAFNYLKK